MLTLSSKSVRPQVNGCMWGVHSVYAHTCEWCVYAINTWHKLCVIGMWLMCIRHVQGVNKILATIFLMCNDNPIHTLTVRQKFALITKCVQPAMWTECFYIGLALSERLYYIHSKQLIFCDSMSGCLLYQGCSEKPPWKLAIIGCPLYHCCPGPGMPGVGRCGW